MLGLYEYFMFKAIELAKEADFIGEVPVGAIIVKGEKIVSAGFNKKETKKNSLFHAEIECIYKASRVLKTWRLSDCDIYVTLEPCLMCTGALVNARIRKIIFGAPDHLNGACVSNIISLKYSYTPLVIGGILSERCSRLLKNFFKNLRKK